MDATFPVPIALCHISGCCQVKNNFKNQPNRLVCNYDVGPILGFLSDRLQLGLDDFDSFITLALLDQF